MRLSDCSRGCARKPYKVYLLLQNLPTSFPQPLTACRSRVSRIAWLVFHSTYLARCSVDHSSLGDGRFWRTSKCEVTPCPLGLLGGLSSFPRQCQAVLLFCFRLRSVAPFRLSLAFPSDGLKLSAPSMHRRGPESPRLPGEDWKAELFTNCFSGTISRNDSTLTHATMALFSDFVRFPNFSPLVSEPFFLSCLDGDSHCACGPAL